MPRSSSSETLLQRRGSFDFSRACLWCFGASSSLIIAFIAPQHDQAGTWASAAGYTGVILVGFAYLWWITDSRAHDGPIRVWGAGLCATIGGWLAAASHSGPTVGLCALVLGACAAIALALLPDDAKRRTIRSASVHSAARHRRLHKQ